MPDISFGGAKHERVAIDVRGYERAATGGYYDDNWLTVSIAVAAGAFRGKVDAAFQVAELVAFRNDLAALYKTLTGRAALRTMEEQLSLDFEGNGLGSVEMRGEILDQPGIGNRLEFALSLDQTQIGAALAQLERVLSDVPQRDV
jgi:hypothetical protein